MKKREKQLINGQWYTKPKRGKPRQLTRCGNTLTESEFINLFVQALRRLTLRWPPREECWKKARIDCKEGRAKYKAQCSNCLWWFSRKEVELDHIDAIGSLRDIISQFADRILPEVEGWQILCKECHSMKTQKARNDIN